MPNARWDRIPVYAWYYDALQRPETGKLVSFKVTGAPSGVKRVDGTAIYRSGAEMEVKVGPDDHDVTARNVIRQALRDRAQAAAGAEFDGAAWDVAWDAALPAMLCLSFPATDDPDITPQGWQVEVRESVTGGKTYPIDLPLAIAQNEIPGLNLSDIEIPPGAPTTPSPTYAKGQPGGVAALDADGDVIDADGTKVVGGPGGGAELTSYETQVQVLADYPPSFPPAAHSHPLPSHEHLASDLTDASTVGQALITAADATAARSAINAAATTHNHSGAYAPLVGGLIPTSNLPAVALTTVVPVANQAAMLALTTAQVQPGDVAVRADGAGSFMLRDADPSVLGSWVLLSTPGAPVSSVNSKTGTVVLSAADVGARPSTYTPSVADVPSLPASKITGLVDELAGKVAAVTGATLVYKLQESSTPTSANLPAGALYMKVPNGTPGAL